MRLGFVCFPMKASMTVVGPIRPKIIVIEINTLEIGDKDDVMPVETPTVA